MTKEEYNKYNHNIDLYYNDIKRVSVECIYCVECRCYSPVDNFPSIGIFNEYRKSGSLCTHCYTKKHKITQSFFNEVLYSYNCDDCNNIIDGRKKQRVYHTNKVSKKVNIVCPSCYENRKLEIKKKKQAEVLLKNQGIREITEDMIKIKLLTLEIKRSVKLKNNKIKFSELSNKEKKQLIIKEKK